MPEKSTSPNSSSDDQSIRLPWEAADAFPLKPGTGDYGYMTKRKMTSCSQQELFDFCKAGTSVWAIMPQQRLVWTPETNRLVPPEEIEYLRDALGLRQHSDAKSNIVGGLMLVGLMLFIIYFAGLSRRTSLYLIVFLGVPTALGLWFGTKGWRAKPRPEEDVEKLRSESRYAAWLAGHELTSTKIILGVVIAIGIFQLFTGGTRNSIEAAGLVKSRVWAGEVWRLLTCTLLHVNWNHFWMNSLALLNLGRLVEALMHRLLVGSIFLFTALCGSLCSLLLLPNKNSVGASGGLMGMIGFLLIAGYRRRRVLPPHFARSIVLDIAIVAAIGIVGYEFIDNAAHLGGLAGGIILGVMLTNRNDLGYPVNLSATAKHIGRAALVIIVLIAVASVFAMLRYALGD